jgi:hypothetical protein
LGELARWREWRDLKRLPMRERQIVEIVTKAREATADEVVQCYRIR